MATYQTVLDVARIPLNDVDKDRYPDDTLLVFANHGVMQVAKRRPDLFVGQYGNMPDGDALPTDAFPLPADYVMLVADYVAGRAELTDDEHITSGRVAVFGKLFATECPE